MTLLGHVRNGMIVADVPINLPEGASVRIEVIADTVATQEKPTVVRQGGQYAGRIWMAPDFDEWPVDMHDALGMIP